MLLASQLEWVRPFNLDILVSRHNGMSIATTSTFEVFEVEVESDNDKPDYILVGMALLLEIINA
jgi:hypothetical protein